MSVATFDARLGQAIQSPDAGCIIARAGRAAGARSPRGATWNETITSAVPARAAGDAHVVGQLAERAASKPSGAPSSSTRCPGLMPSLRGSGVPE